MKPLASYIRSIPDFPKQGILFYDITTLLRDKAAFKKAIDGLARMAKGKKIDYVVSVESRGFIFGAALAYKLGAGFIPVRKKGKLPAETISADYALEYGTDSLYMHKDAMKPGTKILIVDDLLATGGTAAAVCSMANQLKSKITGIIFLIELCDLSGRKKLKDYPVYSLIRY
ncbi:MAG: adenine phosphoribosyltransferase [Candidatus Omnitrophica bacterium]|nr:adenine phosphoribosyltransferase [Candidatus Omnitrophota bacterium]MDD5574807.1 adenine phosphoribosyltransferase [Candidatus Omnitrophota bacterium]